MAGFINLFKFELNYLNTIVFRLLPLTLFSQLSIVSTSTPSAAVEPTLRFQNVERY